MKICCPVCESTRIKKNGHIHNGKQNHYCKKCGRQFVENPEQRLISEDEQRLISEDEREQIRKLLLERISLLGICRVMGVSLRWLLGFIVSEYEQMPDDLNYQSCLPVMLKNRQTNHLVS